MENSTGASAGGMIGSNNKYTGDGLVLAHGIVQTICWCLLVDIALFVVILRHKWWAVLLHALIMLLALAASLALALILVKQKGGLSTFEDLAVIYKVHFILAIVTLSWAGLQLITGILTRLVQIFSKVHPAVILALSWLHKVPGYVLILLAKATCLVGWWRFSTVGFWIVLGWCILMTLLYLFRWTLLSWLTSMSRSFRGDPQYKITPQNAVLNA